MDGNDVWSTLVTALLLAWNDWMLKVLVAHVVVNVVVAYAAAIAAGDFQMDKMWQFLYRKLLPLTMVYVIVKAVTAMVFSFTWADGLTAAAWVSMEAMLLADLSENLEKLGLSLEIISAPVLPSFIRKSK